MAETKLHVIVIIEVSGLSGLEALLKSLFINGKLVESQVPGECHRVLLCKIQNVSVARNPWLPSGELLVTFAPDSYLSFSGWILHSWLLLPLALAIQLPWLGTMEK